MMILIMMLMLLLMMMITMLLLLLVLMLVEKIFLLLHTSPEIKSAVSSSPAGSVQAHWLPTMACPLSWQETETASPSATSPGAGRVTVRGKSRASLAFEEESCDHAGAADNNSSRSAAGRYFSRIIIIVFRLETALRLNYDDYRKWGDLDSFFFCGHHHQ